MKYARMIGYVLLAVLLVSAAPYAAEAAAIRIKPHKFKPCRIGNPDNWKDPHYIGGTGGLVEYYAVVNLPAGKRVTRLTLIHSGSGVSTSVAGLYRVKIGRKSQSLAYVATSQDGVVVRVHDTSIVRAIVRAGYTYYVKVSVGSDNAMFGVKINYE